MDNKLPYKSMEKVLKDAGIYNEGFEKLIKVFSSGLEPILDELVKAMEDVFPLEAEEPSMFELRFRPYPSSCSISVRREMLAARNKISSPSKENMEAKLYAAGLKGNISENYNGGILVDILSSEENLSLAKHMLKCLLPVHLPVFFADETA